MRKFIGLIFFIFSVNLNAETVELPYQGLTTSANLETTGDNWQEGPVVLMLHGTLAHGEMEIMSTLQTLLLDYDTSSLSINLNLGLDKRTGMYDCAVTHTHKHTDSLNEIDLWLNWLKNQGVKSLALLGHSRGANQIAWYASENDDNASISHVILIAPGIIGPGELAKDYQKNYKKPLQPVLDKAKSLVDAGKGSEVMQNTDFIYCPDTQVTAEAFVNYYQGNDNFYTPGLVEKISKPVLIFAGSEDKVVDNVMTEMSKLSDADNIQLISIDGADHFFRDLYAEEIIESVVEALE